MLGCPGKRHLIYNTSRHKGYLPLRYPLTNTDDLKALLVFDSFYLGQTEPITEHRLFRKQEMFL